MGEPDDPVVVDFPLGGEWLVERTPAYRILSHGTDALGQRFAYDLVRTDHRRGFHLTIIYTDSRTLPAAVTGQRRR